MKKLLATLLLTAMIISLAACSTATTGKNPTGSNTSQTTTGTTGTTGTTEPEEIYEIIMSYPTLGQTPQGMKEVEDAINAEIEPALGVRMIFEPIFAFDMDQQHNLMISSGDKLDLMLSLFRGGVGSYVIKGLVNDLTDLYAEHGADIAAVQGPAMSGGYFDGRLYAVPSEEKFGRSYGFFARNDLLEKYDITVDINKIYTLTELGSIFKTIKAGEGSGFYCVAGTNSSSDYFGFTVPFDRLGSTTASGIILNGGRGSTTIVNQFATDEYASFARKMYEFAQAGYFSADAATNTDSFNVQMDTGNYLGQFSQTELDMTANLSTGKYKMTPINLVAPYAATQMYQTSVWAIPITSENPEKTFKFLNYLYADNDIDRLMTYGIEGRTYQVIDSNDDGVLLNWVDGIEYATAPYFQPLKVFGDKSSIGVWPPLELSYYQTLKNFNNDIISNTATQSLALGYSFNSSNVASKFSAVTAVIQQYSAIVSCGAMKPDDVLPTFKQALIEAGIEDVIAENQQQFDQWLENN